MLLLPFRSGSLHCLSPFFEGEGIDVVRLSGSYCIELVLSFRKFPFPDILVALLEMGDVARRMVHDSIDAFIHADAELARRICTQDDIVDEMNRQKFRLVIVEMKKNPDIVEPGAHLIVALKHIERIADHATNIAEDVVFLVDAKVIKHHAADKG